MTRIPKIIEVKSILMNVFNDTVTISETATEDEQRILRARKMSHLAKAMDWERAEVFTEPMEIDACKNKKINKTSFKVVRSNPSMGEGDLSTPTHTRVVHSDPSMGEEGLSTPTNIRVVHSDPSMGEGDLSTPPTSP